MKISVNKNKVGFRINQFRTNKGYTLEDFGELFNTSKSNVHRWEKGLALPNKDRLVKISKLMGMTLNELLYGSVEEFILDNYYKIVEYNRNPEEAEYIKNNFSVKDFIKFYKGFLNDNPAISEKELHNINNIDGLLLELYKVVEKMEAMKEMETQFKGYSSIAGEILGSLPHQEQLDPKIKTELTEFITDKFADFIRDITLEIRLKTDEEFRKKYENSQKLGQEFEKSLKDNKINL